MPPKRSGGIKKHMAEAEALAGNKSRRQLADPSDAPNSSAAASSSATPPLPGGIRKRLNKVENKIETDATPRNKPLAKIIKQK